ncbi:ABC transporter ATP-binding protein [Sulfuritalea sp.]|uniref:ABC transporter ATP-binding protein n=1 Tax=Sulfuritalea sp. TaxID=2480090 RepID=UPI00286E1C9C|nr:ABC transporter ATP-binding protein [Sulfuritalea sp.]
MAVNSAPLSHLLEVSDLSVSFLQNDGSLVTRVNGIYLHVDYQEIVALVGSSGCGKTLTVKALARLDNAATYSGRIEIDHRSVLDLPAKDLPRIRGRQISYLFQNPQSSLNPYLSIGAQIDEVLALHSQAPPPSRRQAAIDLFEQLSVPDPDRRLMQYPHEQSGGIAQRIALAMALACKPNLLVVDEPTSSLDPPSRLVILQCLKQQKRERSVFMVTHDIAAAMEIADRVYVMYEGRLVEHGFSSTVFNNPQHPQTRSLVESSRGSLSPMA